MTISSMVASVWRTQAVQACGMSRIDDRRRLLRQLDDLLEVALAEVEGLVEHGRRGQQVDVVGGLAHQPVEHGRVDLAGGADAHRRCRAAGPG